MVQWRRLIRPKKGRVVLTRVGSDSARITYKPARRWKRWLVRTLLAGAVLSPAISMGVMIAEDAWPRTMANIRARKPNPHAIVKLDRDSILSFIENTPDLKDLEVSWEIVTESPLTVRRADAYRTPNWVKQHSDSTLAAHSHPEKGLEKYNPSLRRKMVSAPSATDFLIMFKYVLSGKNKGQAVVSVNSEGKVMGFLCMRFNDKVVNDVELQKRMMTEMKSLARSAEGAFTVAQLEKTLDHYRRVVGRYLKQGYISAVAIPVNGYIFADGVFTKPE